MKAANDAADAVVAGDVFGVFADVADAAVGAGGDDIQSQWAFVDQSGIIGQEIVYPSVGGQPLADGTSGFVGQRVGDFS